MFQLTTHGGHMAKINNNEIYRAQVEQVMAGIELTKGDADVWHPYNPVTGYQFDAFQRVQLATSGHQDPRWLSESQIKKVKGASINDDAKAITATYFYADTKLDDQGNKKRISIVKHVPLYNAEDCQGLPPVSQVYDVEKAKSALRRTAELNNVEVNANAPIEQVAKAIISSKFQSDGSVESNAKVVLATEFLKSDHGLPVQVQNIKDALDSVKDLEPSALRKLVGHAGHIGREKLTLAEGVRDFKPELIPVQEFKPRAKKVVEEAPAVEAPKPVAQAITKVVEETKRVVSTGGRGGR